ncbi:MAG: dihydrolipoyl dehydrogenase [Christensenellales bacterium]
MYDLIVIGGGPAGYRAAERAGKAGLKTLLIEKREVGGVCLNEGCIPTKTLLYSAKLKDKARTGEKYGVYASDILLNHLSVLARKKSVVSKLVAGIKMQLKQAGVILVSGEAVIAGKSEGFDIRCGKDLYSGKQLLIATGSVPVIPPIPGLGEALKHGFAMTSREILDLETVPAKLLVIGGGAIGLELASYFTSAGSEVTVIEMLGTIGGAIDRDIAKILKKNLERKGIRFRLGCTVAAVGKNTVTVKDQSEKEEIYADLVLVCAGRKAHIYNLGLENIGVMAQNGAVPTDDKLMTNIPGVYAAGDVNGKSMLAHTAYREAEVAIDGMTGGTDAMSYRAVPGVIYTSPETAGVGETETSAREKGMDVTAKVLSLLYSGRYAAENENGDGIAKILIDNQDGRIVGFHMIGSYASEIIYGACMMIENNMTVEQAKKIIFPHPTVSEIIRECLLLI